MFPFNWLVIIWRGGVHLELDIQGQGGGKLLDVDWQGGRGSWKLDNFQGRDMCIIPNTIYDSEIGINGYDLINEVTEIERVEAFLVMLETIIALA